MSYRWDIDEEGPREAGPAGRAGADREAAARQVAMARRRLWLALALTAVLLGAAFAGWRYWRGRRLLAQIAVDVEAAVRLEERALAEGDLELYRRQQSLSRARQLDRAPGLGGERDRRYPPQPGLGIAPSPGTVESVLPATDLPSDGPIRRATVRIRYVVSDSLGVGGFVEPRPYALSDKGRWIHTTHDRAVVEARPLSWKGQRIELRYLPADAERLEPLFARVDALLLRYCAASAACDLPAELPGARRRPAAAQASAGSPVGPARISLTGALPGRGGAMRHAEQRFLGLPAPSLTLVPADAAGEDLLVRQLVRLAILWLADEASGASYLDAFGKPIESLSNQALLLNVLIDAWLAREFDLRLPATPPLTVTPPIGADALPLWGLWLPGSRRESLELWQGFGNPSEAGADPRPERMLRDFARHLARRGDAASLARLIGALPRAEDLEAWLALGYGEAGAELLATWEIPAAPFPAERALLMRCMGNGRQATVLLRPGSRAPQTIHAALCPDAAVGDAAWQPGGGSLALTCQRGGGGSADAEILLARGPRFDAASVARVRGIGGPFVNGPLVWTADGRWLVWAEGGDETRGLRALAVSPNGEPGGVTPLPLPLAELRPISEDTAAVEAGRGQIAVAGHLPIRAAPEAAMLAYERPGGRVAVLDLDDAAAGERWQAPGQDPVWSADGRWVSVLRIEGQDAVLVVLDARTGTELARADARLPELLEAAAEALGEPGPQAVAAAAALRLRVGQGSPEGRWVSLAAALRVEQPRRAATDGYDWSLLVALDTVTGRVLRAPVRGDAYFDGREGFVRWTGEREAWLSHFDPAWWPNGADAGTRPAATRLDLATGEVELLSIEAVRRRQLPGGAMPADPLAAGEAGAVSADGRWLLRAESRFEASAANGRYLRSQLVDLRDGSVDWTLDATYCSELRWQP